MARLGYPIRAVAKMTGISVDTLRAWERRYQAVQPVRDERGRIYGREDVARLLQLKALVERGHAIGRIASLSNAELGRLSHDTPQSAERARNAEETETVPAALAPVFEALEGFDPARLDRELGKLALAYPPRPLVRQGIHPLLNVIGEGWAHGRFSVAQEHLLSAAVRNLIGGMMRLYAPAEAPASVLLATPAGELHEFGILCASLLAAGGGLRTCYLGVNLPASEIAASAEKASVSAVILGFVTDNPRAADELAVLARELPRPIELWIGGREGALPRKPERRCLVLPDFDSLEIQLARLGARF
jgi:MerR family transcriptional regulator, light-induced transcriptional regulator